MNNLYPGDIGERGRSYEHRVRATSVQGESEPSVATTTEVLNERPAAPGAPSIVNLVGNRGIQLEWNENLADADGYQIRTSPDTATSTWPQYINATTSMAVPKIKGSEWVDMGTGVGEIHVLGLSPDNYTFSVRGYNGSGEGESGTSRSYRVDAPTSAWGAPGRPCRGVLDRFQRERTDTVRHIPIGGTLEQRVERDWPQPVQQLRPGLHDCEQGW